MKEPKQLMEKRTSERVPICFLVKLSCEEAYHYGIITNISESGMCIRTGLSLPSGTDLEVHILASGKKAMRVPVRFSRLMKTSGCFDGICVELLNPPESYFDFVENYRTAL